MPSILLVAGEASADLHASHVLRELRARHAGVDVVGIGGDLSQAQGMTLLAHAKDLAVMGWGEVIASLGRITRARAACLEAVERQGIKVAVLLDYAGFNLRLAKELKAKGVRVIYFISPKLWASRASRINDIHAYLDRMLCILPFDVGWFKAHGYAAEYVGNPTLDQLVDHPRREQARAALGLAAGVRMVALLPGSRRMEVANHLTPMLDAAEAVWREQPDLVFLLPRAPTVDPSWLAAVGQRAAETGMDIRVVDGQATHVAVASDAAVVVSGTATLEVGLLGTPMVVIYKAGMVTGVMVHLLATVEWVSLVNLLAGHEVVPEFLQGEVDAANIARELRRLLDPEENARVRQELARIKGALGAPGAPGRVAEVVMEEVAKAHR